MQGTADEILTAYAAGGAAGGRDKDAKQMIITGAPAEVVESSLARWAAVFRGADGWSLRCELSLSFTTDRVPVKVGQPVKLTGRRGFVDLKTKRVTIESCEVVTE